MDLFKWVAGGLITVILGLIKILWDKLNKQIETYNKQMEIKFKDIDDEKVDNKIFDLRFENHEKDNIKDIINIRNEIHEMSVILGNELKYTNQLLASMSDDVKALRKNQHKN